MSLLSAFTEKKTIKVATKTKQTHNSKQACQLCDGLPKKTSKICVDTALKSYFMDLPCVMTTRRETLRSTNIKICAHMQCPKKT